MTDAETVDTPEAVRPPWPGPLVISATPPESAVMAGNFARLLLADVEAWRDQVTAVAADRVPLDRAVEDVAATRRYVAIAADTIGRVGGRVEAQAASRIVERVGGLVGRLAGADMPDVFGPQVAERCRLMAAATEEEFAAALSLCRSRALTSFPEVAATLALGGADAAQEQQRELIAHLAGPQGKTVEEIASLVNLPAARVAEIAEAAGLDIARQVVEAEAVAAGEVVPGIIAALREQVAAAARVSPGSIEGTSPAQAADWARELWAALVPLVGLRVELNKRGGAKG